MSKFIKLTFFLILILLPITDLLFKTSAIIDEEQDSYSFYLRIVVLLLTSSFLIWNVNIFINIFRNSVMSAMGLLLLYILVHFLLSPNLENNILSVAKICFLFSSFFFIYILARYEIVTETDMKWLYTLMAIIVFITIIKFIPVRASLRSGGLMALADSKGYLLVVAFPLLMLFFNKKIFPYLIGLLSIGVLISGKRGAIICLFISILLMFLFFNKEKMWLTNKILQYLILGIVCLVLMFSLFNEYISVAFERVVKLADDKGSGRDQLYKMYWEGYKSSNSFHLTFGYGLYEGAKNLSISKIAHNDWLEVLYDYGLIGLLLYLNVFIQLFRYIFLDIRYRNKMHYFILLSSSLILTIKSIISGTFLMTSETVWLYISIAFVIGRLDIMECKRIILPIK